MKWKSIKDAYRKYQKLEKEDELYGRASTRKKYLFHKQLAFLDDCNRYYVWFCYPKKPILFTYKQFLANQTQFSFKLKMKKKMILV